MAEARPSGLAMVTWPTELPGGEVDGGDVIIATAGDVGALAIGLHLNSAGAVNLGETLERIVRSFTSKTTRALCAEMRTCLPSGVNLRQRYVVCCWCLGSFVLLLTLHNRPKT